MLKWRHNTLLLVLPAVFIGTLLLLYLHVHNKGQILNSQILDYGNVTATDPDIVAEISKDGNYGRNYFAWTADSWPKSDVHTSICLATQGTPNYLHWVEYQARLWKGLISVGVYAPGRDFMAAYNRIKYLRKCYPAIKELVSFHIVFPLEHPPLFTADEAIDVQCSSEEVKVVFETILNVDISSTSKENYPQNHMRNTARNACPTNFTMTADIDMIPWDGMGIQMDNYFGSIEFVNSAYVVPVYEIRSDVDKFPPSSKTELLSLLGEKKARIFHIAVYKKNQFNSHLEKWEAPQISNQSAISVSYKIKKYDEFWEPILVLPSTAPEFFERFIGYGFTRNSHVYFLNLLHFHFSVLDYAFLSHLGFQETAAIYNRKRKQELSVNTKLYTLFKKEMSRKYET